MRDRCFFRMCDQPDEFEIEVREGKEDVDGYLTVSTCKGHLSAVWEFVGNLRGFARMSQKTWLVLDGREALKVYNIAREERAV